MVKQLFILMLVFSSLQSIAQTDTFSIIGRVIDEETGEGIPFASVILMLRDSQCNGTNTDLDGKFLLDKLPKKEYLLVCSYIGYATVKLNKIDSYDQQIVIKMLINENPITSNCPGCIMIHHKVPLTTPFSSGVTWTKEEISRMPYR